MPHLVNAPINSPASFRVGTARDGASLRITVDGPLDLHNIDLLSTAVAQNLDCTSLIVDLSGATFVSASAVTGTGQALTRSTFSWLS